MRIKSALLAKAALAEQLKTPAVSIGRRNTLVFLKLE